MSRAALFPVTEKWTVAAFYLGATVQKKRVMDGIGHARHFQTF
jgi:hypothetical protein